MDRWHFASRIGLFVILSAVFVLKLAVLLQIRHHPLLQPDSGLDTTAYVDLATRVLAGDWALGPGLYFVSPLYIYVLAGILKVSGSFLAVRVVQIALGTVAVGCVFLMAREWFGEAAGWIAAGLAALTGVMTFYEVLILQSSLDAALTAVALWGLTRALRTDAVPRFLLPGLLFGIQTLNRPNVFFAALGLVAVLSIARRYRAAVVMAAGIAIGVAPAVVRNAMVAHQFSLVSSHGGLNFFIGNNPSASGFYQVVPGVSPTIEGQAADTRRVAERALRRPLTDAEVSQYFFDQSWQWIRHEPGAAILLFLRKVGYTFHAQHIALPHSYPFYVANAAPLLRVCVVGMWLLAPLGLAGLVLAAPREHRARYLVWAAFVPLYTVALAMFFVAERYRLPLMPPLCAGAGGLIAAAWRAAREKRGGPVVAGALVTLVLGVVVNIPLAADDGRWMEGMRLTQRLAMKGQYADADAWARRLDADHPPRPGAGSAGLGLQLLVSKETTRALPYLESAHAADPADASVEFALGRAQLRAGRAADAVPHLQRGFEAGIPLPDGGVDYALALDAVGRHEAAATAATQIRPTDPDDVEEWLRLGRFAMESRAPAVAEPFFRRAVALRPGAAPAHLQLGLCLLVAGRIAEAAGALAEAVRLDPANPDSLSHLAYCETSLGQTGAAREHVRAALALDPNDAMARQLAAALAARR